MYLKKVLYTSLLLLNFVAKATDQTIVHLAPPPLDESSIIVKTACDRPCRADGVNISIEKTSEQAILHCYGHGGFGFTTLFGSIQEALDLFLEKDFSPDTPIRVIGSGCMGLCLTIELCRYGYTAITISTKERYNIPSWRAGGFFDPGTGSESAPHDLHRLELGLKTYRVLHAIEEENHPYLPAKIVKLLPVYCPADIECGVEILEKLGLVPESELVTIDFGNGAVHENYKEQLTYFVDISELMKQLWAQINALQIPVIDEEILSFADCTEPVVCNCTGGGSQTLNNDVSVQPARGHLFMLEAQDNPLDYLLFTKVPQNEKIECIYFFPKSTFVSESGQQSCSGILGGTFIPHANLSDNELEELDKLEFKKMAARARKFFYGTDFQHAP